MDEDFFSINILFAKDILTKMNKVDKKSKAYIGLLDDCKKWMQFLPLINGLREDAMRERHWDIIREKVNSPYEGA